MQKFKDRTKKNAIEGAYAATANSLVSGIQASIKAYLHDESSKALVDSEIGKVMISGALSTILMMAPIDVIQNDPRAQKLADKLQEKSVADGLTRVMEIFATTFLPSITQALSSLPEEKKRIQQEVNEEIVDLEEEEPVPKKRRMKKVE